jgi:hypothetical protein
MIKWRANEIRKRKMPMTQVEFDDNFAGCLLHELMKGPNLTSESSPILGTSSEKSK